MHVLSSNYELFDKIALVVFKINNNAVAQCNDRAFAVRVGVGVMDHEFFTQQRCAEFLHLLFSAKLCEGTSALLSLAQSFLGLNTYKKILIYIIDIL